VARWTCSDRPSVPRSLCFFPPSVLLSIFAGLVLLVLHVSLPGFALFFSFFPSRFPFLCFLPIHKDPLLFFLRPPRYLHSLTTGLFSLARFFIAPIPFSTFPFRLWPVMWAPLRGAGTFSFETSYVYPILDLHGAGFTFVPPHRIAFTVGSHITSVAVALSAGGPPPSQYMPWAPFPFSGFRFHFPPFPPHFTSWGGGTFMNCACSNVTHDIAGLHARPYNQSCVNPRLSIILV